MIQTIYQKTIKFAAQRHAINNQLIPDSNLPYVVHLSNVAMEILIAAQNTALFDVEFAIQLALLHDVLEDTETTYEELENEFGAPVAQGVMALTKNSNLTKEDRMMDSLQRIKKSPKEVWAVKLSDRITNLQVPPKNWSLEKIKKYRDEAILIANFLKEGNTYLENRLQESITDYSRYCESE